ncbi:dihydrouridine synthase domain-containing protein, putative [Eimeria maxima]|uniref:Dihydrouridine synthase domain-containing protein, putative n=1 Tax=Eimeria maxima TaxID=5804 RepID=U6MCQ0_EIMMA|nr:dihydrouridine synthase domain-containing protein, putative [Eimeria maxima]CDJ59440.1 dihydrouridine synthase domain-containing protein, putative [Eimeria maxima]
MGEKTLSSRALLAVAPMIAVSNTHFRNFMRLITRYSTLYTEMVVDSTILHNTHQLEEILGFDEIEHPIVCQLGGSNPQTVAEAATWAQRAGYDELNLNVGCPSCRVVAKGCFGAALMRTPAKVRDIVHEIKRRVQIPITVKCRLGIDHLDSPEFTRDFVNGVDPKKNRSIPPLLYGRVFELCDTFPDLRFSLNGGVKTLELAQKLLSGEWREAEDPRVTRCLSGGYESADGLQVRGLHGAYSDYLEHYEARTEKRKSAFVLLKPVLGVLSGMPGQRHFRYALDTKIRRSAPDETAVEVLHHAIDAVDDEFPGVLDYPLNMGKNPRYEEISSSLDHLGRFPDDIAVKENVELTFLSLKDFARSPLGICHTLLAIYATGGAIGASLANSIGPRGTLIVASAVQLVGCFVAFGLEEFNELFNAPHSLPDLSVLSVKVEFHRFGSIAYRCASNCVVMFVGLFPILMARYAFTPIVVNIYRLTPSQSNLLVTLIGAVMIAAEGTICQPYGRNTLKKDKHVQVSLHLCWPHATPK